MSERVLHFGPDKSLVGVMSTPERPRQGAPAVLLFNSGLIHRVGPNRLHVTFARHLCGQGFHVLRFDFAGIGDSRATDDRLTVPERMIANMGSAMDAVRTAARVERFVAMGLCSGAMAAHMGAVADDRIVGCVQLDGYIYATRGFYLRNYGRKLFQPGPWLRFFRRPIAGDSGPTLAPEQRGPSSVEMIPRRQFGAELNVLVRRGTHLLFVLTRGGIQEVNYARQIHDSVPSVNLDRYACVLYYPDSDHTFSRRKHRETMIRAVADWVDASFPEVSADVR